MFVFFVNDAELVTDAYGKYLENQLRKLLGIRKAPLTTIFRSSHEKKEPERHLKTRAPRLGKSRRDMEAAAARGEKRGHDSAAAPRAEGQEGAKPAGKAPGKPGGRATGKPKGKYPGKAPGKPSGRSSSRAGSRTGGKTPSRSSTSRKRS